jgi:alanine racemase
MIRYGVGIYGLNPSGTAIDELPYELEPAMSIESELVFVKQVEAGSAIGYGATYHAEADEWIGTVPIGYADGWLRRMQGFHCLVDGQYCEVVGRVCMDQLMIRLPREYPDGTTVTLIGTNQGKTITLQDAADHAGTIHYELACDLAERLPRVYQGELED